MQVSGLLAGKGSDVVTVAPDTPVGSVAAQLAQHRIGAVVVSGDGSAIDGIVSERDIVRALAGPGRGRARAAGVGDHDERGLHL